MSVDFADWSEAKAFATELSVIGAPLLRLTKSLGFLSSGGILAPGVAQDLFGNVTINQPGYEARFTLSLPAGVGTNPFAVLSIQWGDSVSGQTIATDTFFLTAGNGVPNTLTYYVSGPCKGDQVDMQITNLDPAQNMTVTFACGVNSHIYTWDRILQPAYGATAPIGFTNPAGSPAVGVMGEEGQTLTPGLTAPRLIAVYNGKVRLNINNIGQANAVQVTLQDPASIYGSIAGATFFSVSVAAGGTLNTELVLPNGPVLLTVKNTGGAGNITPVVTILKEEY